MDVSAKKCPTTDAANPLPDQSRISQEAPAIDEWLLRVVGPNFVAGAVFDPITRRCVVAAPKMRWWIKGKSAEQAIAYIKRRGWHHLWMPLIYKKQQTGEGN